MTPASRLLREDYGYACAVCLDFARLPGIGPCPECRPDAYVEYLAGLAELGVVA